MITIREILSSPENFKWPDSLFLPDTDNWTLDTQGIIWDPDDVEHEEDEVPKIVKEHGCILSLDIQTVQCIVSNAKQQIEDCSIQQLFDAFLYYWNHDAFISFS